jgi:O-succinylbenzoic acid--CoA ligase
MTKLALGLRKGDKALLCMPIQYIGARMMIVRTMTAGLDLMVSPPSGHPLRDIDGDLRFVAMLPLQVFNCLQIPVEKERLKSIGILIIGGGAIDQALEDELRNFPNAIYSTYGMTETLSHIALRRLNGDKASPYYHPLPSVKLTLSDENTLIIDAPLICDKQVVTNDVAELRTDGSFRILGRRDNIINSGGIKVQAEALEEKLRPLIPVAFAVTSKPDTRLGEAIVMLIEKSERSTNHIHHIISSTLPPYERPKHIIEVTTIPIAGNGKINRAACRQLAGE